MHLDPALVLQAAFANMSSNTTVESARNSDVGTLMSSSGADSQVVLILVGLIGYVCHEQLGPDICVY